MTSLKHLKTELAENLEAIFSSKPVSLSQSVRFSNKYLKAGQDNCPKTRQVPISDTVFLILYIHTKIFIHYNFGERNQNNQKLAIIVLQEQNCGSVRPS